MSNPSLLERVEAATGADRGIDAALLTHFCPGALISQYLVGDDEPSVFHAQALGIADKSGVPAYTASLDAALSLVERVLPGWDWSVHSHRHTEPSHRDAWAGVRAPPKGIVSGILYEANGYTPALALLAALLKATEEKPQP